MIGRIHGRLLEISGNLMLVDVGGVAYEVEVTTAALSDGATSGADVTLFTHFVVREDAQQLYGFGSRTERDVFRDLIKINGVGPKLALSILSGLSLDALADAIRAHDVALLTRVPGVGR
ncbi:MAG: Holliday junction branch migration protein RuvA, partial [Gammaproteobacteria bacterium]